MAIAMKLKYTIDVNAPLKEIPAQTLLAEGDKKANIVQITVLDDGKAADLTGCTAYAYFVRETGDKVRVSGSINGNVISVTMTEPCYYVPGSFAFNLLLGEGTDTVRTIARLTGFLISDGEGREIDPESTLPSADEIEQYIKEMQEALVEAETATDNANTATDKANNAADAANAAAAEIENLTITATTLPTGSEATASYADGVLTLGLPRGEKGDTGSAPPITVNGIEAVDDNITINGKNIPLSPFDSRSVEATVMERSRVENLLDNAWWGDSDKIVNQRGSSSYTGSMYTIDRWRTWSESATVQITTSGLNTRSTLYQYLDIDPDETYTALVCKSDGTVVSVSGVPSTGFTKSPITVVVGTGDLVTFTITSGTYLWAALYKGDYTWSTEPAFVPKPYAAEVLECQRYFRKIQGSARLAGFCTSTTAYLSLPMTVPMVGTPTITVSSYGTIRGNGNNITPTGASISSANADSINISVTYASTSGMSNHLCVWASPVFTLSADYNP